MSIKNFERIKYREERKKVAGEIQEKRREYFKDQKTIGLQIEKIKEELEQSQANIKTTLESIKNIELVLAQKKENILLQLFNIINIANLKKDLMSGELTLAECRAYHDDLLGQLMALEEQKKDKSLLGEARQVLRVYKAGIEEKKLIDDFEKEQYACSVESLRGGGTLVIHGILPNYVPGGNSLLAEGTDWKTKYKILSCFSPTLSTSTFRLGDSRANMWGGAGVLLAEGQVVGASHKDAATVAQGFTRRGMENKDILVSHQIEDALQNRGAEAYNELIVANPKILGMYVYDRVDSVEKKGMTDGSRFIIDTGVNDIPKKEVITFCETYGIPVFCIRRGGVYDQGGQKIDLNVLANAAAVKTSPEVSEEFRTDIFFEAPFNIEIPEKKYFDSRYGGFEMYIRSNTEFVKHFLGASEEKFIEHNSSAGVQRFFLDSTGKLMSIRFDNHGKEVSGSESPVRPLVKSFTGDITYTTVCPGSTFELEGSVGNSTEYLLSFKEGIVNYQKKLLEKKGDARLYLSMKKILTMLIFHLDGFLAAVDFFGQNNEDSDLHKDMRTFLSDMLIDLEGRADYITILLKKRVGVDGKFLLLEEDLDQIR